MWGSSLHATRYFVSFLTLESVAMACVLGLGHMTWDRSRVQRSLAGPHGGEMQL